IKRPLGLPVIFAGIRTAAVQVVSAATLAAFIGGGGLGELIAAGMGTFNMPQLVVGGLAVAALAVATELGFALLEWGMRRRIMESAAWSAWKESARPLPASRGRRSTRWISKSRAA